MNSRALRVLIVAAVALAAVGALAGGAAAATDTLAGDGTDTVTDFNASSSDHIEYTLSADDGTNGFDGDGSTTLLMNITENGEEHVEVSNSSFDGTATSYTFNVSQDELGTIPGDANSTTNITVNAWGEDDAGNVTTTVDTFNADLEFHDGYAVIYVGDSAAAGDVNGVDVNAEEASGILATIGYAEDSYSVDADSVGLGQNASGTTVHVVVANQSNVSAFDDAQDKLVGSYESGDFLGSHLLEVGGHTHAVFNEEAPVDDLADGYTYATYGERNGNDAYAIHVDDDYEGESSLDVSTTANDGPSFGFLVKRDAFGGTLGALSAAALLFGSLGRRE